MRIAVLSDVHGNLPALEICLERAAALGCDSVVCLGDVMGYLPEGKACFERLEASGAVMLLGNHEAMLVGRLDYTSSADAVYQITATRGTFDAAQLDRIGLLSPRMEVTWGRRRFLLVHGTPSDPLQGYAYPDSDLSGMSTLPFDYVVMGNTHRRFERIEGTVRVVNVGSVGLPRDVGNRASFGTYDVAEDRFELVQVPLDTDMLRNRYHDAHESVLNTFDRR